MRKLNYLFAAIIFASLLVGLHICVMKAPYYSGYPTIVQIYIFEYRKFVNQAKYDLGLVRAELKPIRKK